MALFGTLVRLGIEAGILRGAAAWVGGQDRWRRRMADVAAGIAWLLLAAVLGSWAVAAAVGSIFFQLAELGQFVVPALWAGGVLLLVALLAAVAGWQKLRRPSHYTSRR